MTRPDNVSRTAGAVFNALADPTRRTLFEAVAARGPLTATALAGEFPVSRQAITKHLSLLADAGLVASARAGRETRWSADPAPFVETRRWMDTVGVAWDRRLADLATHLDRDPLRRDPLNRDPLNRDATERTNRATMED